MKICDMMSMCTFLGEVKSFFVEFAILVLLLFSSCEKQEAADPDQFGLLELTESSIVATGSVVDIAWFGAKLQGSVKLDAVLASKYEVGVICSTTPEISLNSYHGTKNTITQFDNNTFMVFLSELKPGNCYYYRSFLSINGKTYYGNEKQFNTLEINNTDYVGDYEGSFYVAAFADYDDGKLTQKSIDEIWYLESNVSIKVIGGKLQVMVPVCGFNPYSSPARSDWKEIKYLSEDVSLSEEGYFSFSIGSDGYYDFKFPSRNELFLRIRKGSDNLSWKKLERQ